MPRFSAILTLAVTAWTLLAAATVIRAEDEKKDEKKYDLVYKFKPGEVIRSEIRHAATIETTIKGSTQTAQTRSDSVKAWKIESVDPKAGIKLVHSVESVNMMQKVQGRQEVRFSSSDGKTPPAGYEEAAKAIGVPLTRVTIDTRGKILDREALHDQPNAAPGQMTVPLPEEPIAVGYVWNQPEEIDVPLQPTGRKLIQAREQYTLTKVEGNVATIAVETQVLTPMNDPQIEAELVQRLLKGTIEFDIDRGRVVSQDLAGDRSVLEISGPSSVMRYSTHYLEKLLPEKAAKDSQTATKPAAPVKAAPKR